MRASADRDAARGAPGVVSTHLALQLEDGDAWASTASVMKFGWEIAKANVKDGAEPDVRVHVKLSFD